MKRPLAALLLAVGLVLTGCSGNQSGDSNPDRQTDQLPGQPGDAPSTQTTPAP